jgi:hypothetical protein
MGLRKNSTRFVNTRPTAHFRIELAKTGANQMRGHANVGVALAKLSSPFPHVSEHFLMKPQQVLIIQHVGECSGARAKRPFLAAKNVLRFRFVELSLRRNARELEAADVLLGEWRCAGRIRAD